MLTLTYGTLMLYAAVAVVIVFVAMFYAYERGSKETMDNVASLRKTLRYLVKTGNKEAAELNEKLAYFAERLRQVNNLYVAEQEWGTAVLEALAKHKSPLLLEEGFTSAEMVAELEWIVAKNALDPKASVKAKNLITRGVRKGAKKVRDQLGKKLEAKDDTIRHLQQAVDAALQHNLNYTAAVGDVLEQRVKLPAVRMSLVNAIEKAIEYKTKG